MPDKILFLPGASGNTQFWQPVAQALPHPAEKIHMGWPGFGDTPPRPDVHGLADLAGLVKRELNGPTALVAQSMGGVVAVLAALQNPQQITHLVLTATSGGVDTARLGAQDWRAEFARNNPGLPDWFGSWQTDLSARLTTLAIPTLLLWGDADPISPVAVGEHLARLLPRAELHVFTGGDHGFANSMAADIAPLIARHLAPTA
ncbi:pimeloyl-ACP methyl ester carboxylesterase [Silvimonas terrae]|uniref:Pimeloyl-ACP methyl ester carboxylesterase n=1 Tax=Silvimonas terrae TaxID=300266 RepID=A0A840R7Y5_9NEIS|nr:alpha/beta fold hydrolase [Silvimonas terrae]MBB5189395.1 pimeloyl-ACP methyl ester carboxylesterase [Silvimonas terrae]